MIRNVQFIITLVILIVIMVMNLMKLNQPEEQDIKYISSSNDFIKVPFANQTIMPMSKINEDMVSYVPLPPEYLQGDYIMDISEIVGKCIGYSAISMGSPFYHSLLVDCDTINN